MEVPTPRINKIPTNKMFKMFMDVHLVKFDVCIVAKQITRFNSCKRLLTVS